MKDQKLLTPDEACQMLAIKRWKLDDMARKGEIPFVKIGGERRYIQNDLCEWVKAQRR